jgi:ring-1,2-phenylacetyl-CoA epoxidase subunit PaaE
MSEGTSLVVSDIIPLTQDAKAITLGLPESHRQVFRYRPGQFLTLEFELGGETVRRSYSLCGTPLNTQQLTIGVKKVKNGLVSSHIHNHLKPGHTVKVLPPAGRFSAQVAPEQYKSYYLFAAGSGITPLLAIARTVLQVEQNSFVYLLFGNRDQGSIMFANHLLELEQKYSDRFTLVHQLSRPKSRWSDLWTSRDKRPYRNGRIDADSITDFINQHPPKAQNAEYYICGPGTMMNHTREALRNLDVPENRLFLESFGRSHGDHSNQRTVNGVDAQLHIHLKSEKTDLDIKSGESLLKAMLREGLNPPYSCEAGVCGRCRCLITKGKVKMKSNYVLTENEISEGYTLACQSVATSDNVTIKY